MEAFIFAFTFDPPFFKFLGGGAAFYSRPTAYLSSVRLNWKVIINFHRSTGDNHILKKDNL
jgi:hypothetical protein